MAELVFKSAGVSTREIDLSFPSNQQAAVGVPAGIIGTANEGPAFVPVTVTDFNQFQTIYGASDGKKFGPLAVSQWLKNARSCTYIRVLGIGDGKKRTSTGVVTNAGFLVGKQQVQVDGNVGASAYANAGDGDIEGRTYFLGCFMSESAGSTIFSSAGLQGNTQGTKAVAGIKCLQNMTGTVILSDWAGKRVAYHFHTGTNGTVMAATGSQNIPGVLVKSAGVTGGSAAEIAVKIAANFSAAVNSVSGHGGATGTISGTLKYNGTDGGTDLAIFTQSNAGAMGNRVVDMSTQVGTGPNLGSKAVRGAGTASGDTGWTITPHDALFRSGSGTPVYAATPIIRGILLAPSGVQIALSASSVALSHGGNHITASNELTARYNTLASTPRAGSASTGSLTINNQNFVMLLNGHKGTSTYPNTLTASFDLLSNNYFGDVFNTDPLKIEQAGHLLYNRYDVYPTLAAVTGSGAVFPGHTSKGFTVGAVEDIAFILTSSVARSATGANASSTVPDYEDFQDRFANASSPFVISQKYGNDYKNLFKIHALSAGARANTRFKISIENLSRRDDKTYGTFDLVVRDFYDSDESKLVLESFRGLSLDPSSDRFIARSIGDLNVFFDFDKDNLSQKINVTGNHPVRSRFIRVQQSDDLLKGNIPV